MESEQSLTGFLDDLASSAPTPGGGGAAALMAASGAALVAMVCRLTLGREKFVAVAALMEDTLEQAEGLRRRATALIATDAAAYDGVSAAYALPKSTADEKATRSAAIQAALVEATRSPLETAQVALRILQAAAAIVDSANPNVLSDVGVGALAAHAALDGAILNVHINLKLIKDAAFVSDTSATAIALVAEAAPLSATVRQRMMSLQSS